MPRQVDQLPPDATSLARRVQALERQVTELRAARRLTSATVGTLRTSPDGARAELSQNTQSVRVYAADGTTVLAELGPEDGGEGGGLWTRGLQNPINISGYLTSGELRFRPVDDGMVAVPASVYYDSDAFQYSDLTLTSGAVNPTDHRALLILESLFDGSAHVSVQGEASAPCTFDVLGIATSSNIVAGTVAITPSAANTPTSVTVSGLNVPGSYLRAWTGIANPAPGSTSTTNGVTGTGYSNLTSSGMTVWATRQNTTAVTVSWLIMGFDTP